MHINSYVMSCCDYFDDKDVNWQERYGLLRLMMLLIMMTAVMMIMIMMMTMMMMMITKMKMIKKKQVIICLRIASDFIPNQFSVFKVLLALGVFIKKQTSIKLVLILPTIRRWKKSRPPRLEITDFKIIRKLFYWTPTNLAETGMSRWIG